MTEARAHHFVPQCWLAGFTDTVDKDGKLHVTDLQRKKQFGPISPQNVGHRKDYYRISNPPLEDPVAVEKIFADIESTVGPVLKALDKEKRGHKDGVELGTLLEYMAIQFARVPAFRATIDRTIQAKISQALISPQAWENTLHELKMPLDHPGANYEKFRS
jgi:hypothetical protein